MSGNATRRTYLGVVGSTVVLGAIESAAARGREDPCSDASGLAATLEEKRAKLRDLEDETERIRTEQIPDLETETAVALEAWRDEQHVYDAATLERARETGITMREGVVQLRVEFAGSRNFDLSTAWYARENLLLTNAHNVEDYRPEDTIAATTLDGTELSCELVNSQAGNNPDVALLRTAEAGTPLPTASADQLERGAPLVQVGHPGDLGNWVITMGEVLSFTNSWGEPSESEFQSTVSGMQGSSGSPVATLDGTVVGMLYSGRMPTGGDPDGTPEPAPVEVRTEPLASDTTGGVHVTAERSMELLEEWT